MLSDRDPRLRAAMRPRLPKGLFLLLGTGVPIADCVAHPFGPHGSCVDGDMHDDCCSGCTIGTGGESGNCEEGHLHNKRCNETLGEPVEFGPFPFRDGGVELVVLVWLHPSS